MASVFFVVFMGAWTFHHAPRIVKTYQSNAVVERREEPRIASVATESSKTDESKKQEIIMVYPFRNRYVHYEKIMSHLKTIQRPHWVFPKILVEQDDNDPFRRAWLLNVGIAEAMKRFKNEYLCRVTHDVDMFADVNVDYGWCDRPTQICSEISCFDNGVPYSSYAGGVVQATMKDWYKINGFTNNAKGWGGEDDDLYHRFRMNQLLGPTGALRRPEKGNGKCECMNDKDHTKRVTVKEDYTSIVNQIGRMEKNSEEWKLDGLNTLKYHVTSEHKDAHDTIHLKVTATHATSIPTVYTSFVCRLGNHLFRWVSSIGISKKNRINLCVIARSELLDELFKTSPDTCSSSLTKNTIGENKEYATYHDFTITQDTILEGYLQSFKYFPSNVYEYLEFKPEITTKAQKQMVPEKTNVGIHVRQAHQHEVDYLTFPPNEYFEKVMTQFRREYPDALFYVACDNVSWCKSQPFFKEDDVQIIENSPGLDMAVLASCDHMILTVGTFGWWAAFLGAHKRGGKVIYYKDEFNMQHQVNKGNVVKEDYYPENWITSEAYTKQSVEETTLVTAYFNIPSKHTHTEYLTWMSKLMTLRNAMVIFTTKDMVPVIYKMRKNQMEKTLIISTMYASVYF